jgi:transcription antitermination factor NusG
LLDEPWVRQFSPAIIDNAGRKPEWFVLRYVAGKQRLLLWLLRYIGLAHHHLIYMQRMPRSKPVERAWVPGYLFVQFDPLFDNWGQVARMPYALEVLGDPTPLPTGLIDDLVARLPLHLAKPSALSCVAPGARVRVRSGSFLSHEATVIWSDRRRLKVLLMLFGRPVEVTLDIRDVEIM